MSTTTSVASRSFFDHQNPDTSVSDFGEKSGHNRHSMISNNPQKKPHREVRFGAYVLGSTLGEGEFGKVKLGWRKDGKHPSQVAIKLIRRDTIVKDLESEIKIYREINSLRLLNHPNIVNLVEVLKSGKYIGIVLEYASGGELFDFILKHKYLKENVAKKLFAQLVSGVDYMHSKGLIHRDLKLENLLLDKHKNVIISDFGFVNSYNKLKNDLMKTSCGSPCYAAPELVLTQSPYAGRKVDIWLIGVILYAMLAGYLPFDDDAENEDGADIVKLYNYICSNSLTFPEYVLPLARDLLRKIIVPNPAKRISMDEIRAHPWLAPHVGLLSIRQAEWDRLASDEKERHTTALIGDANRNKRYSMFPETTNSLALMLSAAKPLKNMHGRSYTSSSNISYSHPTTLSSLAHVVALPSDNNASGNVSAVAGTNAGARRANEDSSPTRSTQPHFTRGHAKSTSLSGTYPSASVALKAIVSDTVLHHATELDITPAALLATPLGVSVLAREGLSRVSTYTGSISTIAETDSTAISTAANSDQVPKNLVPTSERLPHAQRRPRPTSYHPGSMSSSLSITSANSTSLLDYMKMSSPGNKSVPLLSGSPTKSLYRVESAVSTYESQSSPGSLSTLPTRSNTRRDSFVTPINVNGVLASDQSCSENKRNSVLSYLEDKMDTLELTELHSPVRHPVDDGASATIPELPKLNLALEPPHETPKLDQLPTFAVPTESPVAAPLQARGAASEIELPASALGIENSTSANLMKESRPLETIQRKERNKENRENRENKENKENKEAKDAKEAKKKNRFSILSFYSTSNTSNYSLSSTPKKVLEPSNDANVFAPSGQKDHRQTDSSSSGNVLLSRKTSTSTASTSTYVNGREASAARKVMNFFKRKSVRIG